MHQTRKSYREEDLAEQFEGRVKGITFDPAVQLWLVRDLKKGRTKGAFLCQDMTDPLQNEVKTFKNRLKKDYSDKLDGKISEELGHEKLQPLQAEHDHLVSQQWAYQTRNRNTEPKDSLNLIELA